MLHIEAGGTGARSRGTETEGRQGKAGELPDDHYGRQDGDGPTGPATQDRL